MEHFFSQATFPAAAAAGVGGFEMFTNLRLRRRRRRLGLAGL